MGNWWLDRTTAENAMIDDKNENEKAGAGENKVSRTIINEKLNGTNLRRTRIHSSLRVFINESTFFFRVQRIARFFLRDLLELPQIISGKTGITEKSWSNFFPEGHHWLKVKDNYSS